MYLVPQVVYDELPKVISIAIAPPTVKIEFSFVSTGVETNKSTTLEAT